MLTSPRVRGLENSVLCFAQFCPHKGGGLCVKITLVTMFEFLHSLLHRQDRRPRAFDRNMVLAKVVDYDMTKHQRPDQKIDLFGCHLQYAGGPKCIVAVPYYTGAKQSARFYAYNLDSGEVEDHLGEIFLPQ